MTTLLLETRDLGYTRCGNTLFSGINLILPSGGLVHVLGNNGSGKTSLLKLLSGLLPIEQGSIIKHSPDLIYIGHKLGIKLGLTARENLKELTVLYNIFDIEHLKKIMQDFELNQFSNIPCAYLSAGQRQRVALARLLLLKKAKIWILDEPFNHLDKNSCEILIQCIQQHCLLGGGVVLASHQEHNIITQQQTVVLS